MNTGQYILLACVRIYRYAVSPAKTFIFGSFGQCRFTPSCSAYAQEAIARHGALMGLWLAVKRLGRCHPWGGCGADPVPLSQTSSPRMPQRPSPNLCQHIQAGGDFHG